MKKTLLCWFTGLLIAVLTPDSLKNISLGFGWGFAGFYFGKYLDS